MVAKTIGSGLCACGSPRRPGGYDCRSCHRQRMRLTRIRQRERQKLLETTVKTLTVENRNTREKFESACRSRYVIVFDPNEGALDYPGMVVGFLPADMLSVADGRGYVHAVPLSKVKEDFGRQIKV